MVPESVSPAGPWVRNMITVRPEARLHASLRGRIALGSPGVRGSFPLAMDERVELQVHLMGEQFLVEHFGVSVVVGGHEFS
jgi:hypothetical protein